MKSSQVSAHVQPKQMDESPAEEASETPEFEKHEVEGAADTMTKAAHIKMHQPKLHAAAIKHLNEKKDAIHAVVGSSASKPKSLDDLRKLASEKSKL